MMNRFLALPLVLASGLAMANFTHAAQWSASLGATGQGNMTYRIGLSQDWSKSWLTSETGRLTGYWDAGYTYWEGAEYSGAHSLSFSPVFVYEFAGEGVQPFIELGVGVSFFSKTDVGERQLGSSFNFEDRLGIGLKLSATQKVGMRAIHYSNAGLKSPNAGIESFALFYNQAF